MMEFGLASGSKLTIFYFLFFSLRQAQILNFRFHFFDFFSLITIFSLQQMHHRDSPVHLTPLKYFSRLQNRAAAVEPMIVLFVYSLTLQLLRWQNIYCRMYFPTILAFNYFCRTTAGQKYSRYLISNRSVMSITYQCTCTVIRTFIPLCTSYNTAKVVAHNL